MNISRDVPHAANGAPPPAPRPERERRVLPHNLDAEASILGGIILRNESLEVVSSLEVDDFYDMKHKIVFGAMRALEYARVPIDVVTLENEVEKQGKLDAIGGIAFLGELALKVPTVDNVEHYARLVRGFNLIRKVALAASAAAERVYTWQDEPDEYVAMLVEDIARLERAHLTAERRCPPGGRRLTDVIPKLVENRGKPIFKTGLPQVDAEANLMGGHVVVLIGSSGSGKSSLTLQVARNHAATLGPALLASLELNDTEVASRIVSRECDVSWFAALRGAVGDVEMRRVLDEPRFRVVDDHGITPTMLRTHVLALQRQYPNELVLVVVDYVQILDAAGRDERERVKNAIEGLRKLAKDLGVVLWLVSQSSREGAKALRRGDAVGIDAMSTGAESSQIERAAYVTFSLGEITDSADGNGPVVVDFSIGKTRMSGGDRVLQLEYDGRRGLFAEVGQVISASRHKADKADKKKGKGALAASHAIAEVLSRAESPMSQKKLRAELGINNGVCGAAVALLMAEDPPRVVRVQGKKVGGVWPLWTPSKAEESGVLVVPKGVD